MTAVAGELRASGRGPRWWRTGVRTRLWWAAALGVVVIWAADFYATWHWYATAVVIEAFVGLAAEAAVGLLFWMWRPGNIVGPLLLAYFALILISDLPGLFPASRLALTLGLLLGWLFWPVYVHMLFVFPNGELVRSRWARPLLACQYVWALLMWLPELLFSPTGIPTPNGIYEATSYLYLGDGWSGTQALVGNWEKIWWIGELALLLAVVVVLIARLFRASPGARRRLLPLYSVAALVIPFNFSYVTIHVFQESTWAGWFWYVWYCFF